jgi:hypothetical protein
MPVFFFLEDLALHLLRLLHEFHTLLTILHCIRVPQNPYYY